LSVGVSIIMCGLRAGVTAAKALGLAIPRSLVLRANEVIE
jgi:hypothetical protein